MQIPLPRMDSVGARAWWAVTTLVALAALFFVIRAIDHAL